MTFVRRSIRGSGSARMLLPLAICCFALLAWPCFAQEAEAPADAPTEAESVSESPSESEVDSEIDGAAELVLKRQPHCGRVDQRPVHRASGDLSSATL